MPQVLLHDRLPRSIERGPVEATSYDLRRQPYLNLPRSIERGPVEADRALEECAELLPSALN